jgi:acyl-coenzyme A synthetase/AMP-(fatty) acid ligase
MSDTPAGTLGDLPDLAADKHGQTAFLCDQPWLGYGAPVLDVAGFAHAVHDYADRFWAAGIRAGDTVVVVQRNHIEVQALACGLNRIGALPVLLSVGIEPEEIVECAGRLEQPYLAVDAAGAARLAGQTAALQGLTKRILFLTEGGNPETSANEAASAEPSWAAPTGDRQTHRPSPRGEDDWAVITHTSGTTSVPKLAAHSTRSLYGVVRAQIAASRAFGQVGLSAKHLSFVHARTCSIVLAFLEVAMPILAIGDARPEPVRQLMLEHRPDSLETHPNVFIRWEPVAGHPSQPFSSVTRFVSTFDAIHPRTVKALLAGSDQPGANYIQAYGQTETGGVTARLVTRDEAAAYRPRNVGFAIEGSSVLVAGEDGSPVPAGQAGAIFSKTIGRFRGYIGAESPVDEQWWPMGDIGRINPDGSLELLDRLVDHAEGTDSFLEVEDTVLDRLPELIELVMLKEVGGHDVVAVACPREGEALDPGRLLAALRETSLGAVPVYVMDFDELPLTGSYKVRRLLLRSRLVASGTAPTVEVDA